MQARWIGGALWVHGRRGGVLVDAPPGVEAGLLREGLLHQLRGVVLTSGRSRAVCGLPGLWEAFDRTTRGGGSLTIVHVLGDERTPLLAGAWAQGWPDSTQLNLDGLAPGGLTDVGGIDIELVPLRLGEARWGPMPTVGPVTGCGARFRSEGQTFAWVPACRPGTAAQRLALGADLAVIEVGRVPWPPQGAGWRLSWEDAAQIGAGAGSTWIVGDDGERLSDPGPPN